MLNRSQVWMLIGVCFLWSNACYSALGSALVPNTVPKILPQSGNATIIETHVSPYSANIIDPTQSLGIPLACPTGDAFLDKVFYSNTGPGNPNALWYRCIHPYSLSEQNNPSFQAELNGWVTPCSKVAASVSTYYQLHGVPGNETCTFINTGGGPPLVNFIVKTNDFWAANRNPNPAYSSSPSSQLFWNNYVSITVSDANNNQLTQGQNQSGWSTWNSNATINQASTTFSLLNPSAGAASPIVSGEYLVTLTAMGLNAYTNAIGCSGTVNIDGSMAGHTYECTCTVDYLQPSATYVQLGFNSIININTNPPSQCAAAWSTDKYIVSQKAAGNIIWIPNSLIIPWPTGPITTNCNGLDIRLQPACTAYLNCMKGLSLPANPIQCTQIY